MTLNACKDLLKSFFRSHTVSIEEVLEQPAALPEDNREVLQAVLSLPQKYKDVIYLHYYEGYTAPQMSKLLGKNVNTIYTCLLYTSSSRTWPPSGRIYPASNLQSVVFPKPLGAAKPTRSPLSDRIVRWGIAALLFDAGAAAIGPVLDVYKRQVCGRRTACAPN